MKIEDIDFVRRRIPVFAKRKERYVYFGKPAAQALRAYLQDRKQGPVFLDIQQQQKGYICSCETGWQGRWREYPSRRYRVKYLGRLTLSRSEAQAIFDRFVAKQSILRTRHPIKPDGIQQRIHWIGEKAHLRNVSPRLLRHTFATHLLDNGADLQVIQQLLGHTLLSTTRIYMQVSTRRVGRAYVECHPRAHQ